MRKPAIFAFRRTTIVLACALLSLFLQAQMPAWQWVHGNGGEHKDDGKGVAIGPDGSVYQLGAFKSPSITLGNITLTNWNAPDSKMFLAKYTPDGELIWVRTPTGSLYGCMPEALCLDNEGNIIVGGGFQGYSMNFGAVHLDGGDVSTDTQLFLVKFDAEGNGIWGYSQGGTLATEPEYIMDVCTDSENNVIALGNTYSSAINFGGTVYQRGGTNMAFLLKFSPTGAMLHVATSYSQCSHFAYSVRADEFDNIFIGGNFFNTYIRFGTMQVSTAGVNDHQGFVFKFDTLLHPMWARTIGGSGDDDVYGVAPDGQGHLFVVGTSGSYTVTSAGMSVPNAYADGGMVARFDLDGNTQWIRMVADSLAPGKVEIDAQGQLVAMATTTAQLPFMIGNSSVQNTGPYSTCLFSYAADGTPLWAEAIVGSSTYTGDIAIASPTDIFVTGMYAASPAYFGGMELPLIEQVGIYYSDVFLARLYLEPLNVHVATHSASDLSIFPVPSSSLVNYRVPFPVIHIQVSDVFGREVMQASGPSTNKGSINVAPLPPGVYLARLVGQGAQALARFVRE